MTITNDPTMHLRDIPQPMDPAIAAMLLRINRDFYARFADEYADSRSPNQAGLRRMLDYLPTYGWLLDVGCGQGRLARLLDQEQRRLAYVGVDSSPQLLAIARNAAAGLTVTRALVEADITAEGWIGQLSPKTFETVVALAVLHHIPGWQQRSATLARLASLLTAQGVLVLSTWQFLDEARLRRKIVAWAAAGLTPDQVEPGDYLLDWKRGGLGLRYCHLVDEAELLALAWHAGLDPQVVYYEDGRSRHLNLFGVFRLRG